MKLKRICDKIKELEVINPALYAEAIKGENLRSVALVLILRVLVLPRPKRFVDDMNPDVRVAVIIKRSNRRDKVLVPREPRFRRYYTDPE